MSMSAIVATNLSDCKRFDATDMPTAIWLYHDMVERVVANAILAENLRRIIEKSGMSPRGWARNHGIVERNVQRILKQQQSPSLELLQ